MRDRLVRVLSQTEPFTMLDGDALERLAAQCRFVRFEAKQQIIGYQEDSADVFFVVSGTVRVVIHSMLGREITYRDLEKGELFGELAAIDGEQRSASVVAVTDTVLVAMPAQAFRAALREHPDAADAVMKRLTHLVRLYSQRLYELRTLDVQSRVRAELVRMAQDLVGEDNTAVISPLPTHSSIANRVCTRREAVSRELARLARRGLVVRRDKALEIRDYARLVDMVESVLGEPDGLQEGDGRREGSARV